MTENNKISTIQCSQATKDNLAKLGSKGESYEDIIKRLIVFYEMEH